MVAWLIRHAAWLLNRFAIGRDGFTPFERSLGVRFQHADLSGQLVVASLDHTDGLRRLHAGVLKQRLQLCLLNAHGFG